VACRYIIFTQLLSALVQLNGQKLIHSDVKPDNILRYYAPPAGLTTPRKYFSIKLADLGAAMPLDSPEPCEYGTLHFRAPEHRYMMRQNGLLVFTAPNTDTWAAGLVLADCLMGFPIANMVKTDRFLDSLHEKGLFTETILRLLCMVPGLELKWLEMVHLCLQPHTIRPSPETMLKLVTSHPLFAAERAQMRALGLDDPSGVLVRHLLPCLSPTVISSYLPLSSASQQHACRCSLPCVCELSDSCFS
jgi:serine/threonine protein kinase